MAQTPVHPPSTEQKWLLFFEHLRGGLMPFKAARRAGLTPAQLSHRRKTVPDHVEQETLALAEYAEVIEQYIHDVAIGVQTPDKDRLKAAKDWLQVRNRQLWGEQDKTITHRHEVSIKTTDDVLALRAQLASRALPVGDDPNIIDAEVIEDEV